MQNIGDEIREIEKKKEILQSDIQDLEMLKGLLYETGKYGLEVPVRKAFRIIGFNVLDPKEYEEEYDLYAQEDDIHVIGEIEGSKGQIDVKKYRQLLDYVTESVLQSKNTKGILIGNGYINDMPEQRKDQFTERATIGCKTQKYCRLATTELYKAVECILSNPCENNYKNIIKKSLMECENEFIFDEVKNTF